MRMVPLIRRRHAQKHIGRPQKAMPPLNFRGLLNHSGSVRNCWTEALPHLGVARADGLQIENLGRARMPAPPASGHSPLTKTSLPSRRDADPGSSHPEASHGEHVKPQSSPWRLFAGGVSLFDRRSTIDGQGIAPEVPLLPGPKIRSVAPKWRT
jgi:hypothetical protein